MVNGRLATALRHIRRFIGATAAGDTTDCQLLERFRDGHDEGAFATLVHRHGPLVLSVCRRVLRDPHDADDAFQATFIVLARKASSIRRHDAVGAWLYGVAYRIAARIRGQNARRRTEERKTAAMRDASLEPAANADDLQPILDDELNRLPEKYRLPLVLHYFQGKSTEEAARELGWPPGSLTWRLSRARDILRTRLSRRGVVLSASMLVSSLTASSPAAVPDFLAETTLQTVHLLALGKTSAVAAHVCSLAEGAIQAMMLSKLKRSAVVLLVSSLLAVGIGVTYRSLAAGPSDKDGTPPLLRSAQSGPWSAAATWEGGKVPPAGARVQVRPGHTVVYDLNSEQIIRSIHVAGTLRFDRDKDTRLDVGLVKIQPGEDASENGFDCEAHMTEPDPKLPRPALEVGTSDRPISGHTALIRLTYVDGLDKQSCPAIVCCGGRLDLHGTPMKRTWVKLGQTPKKGDTTLTLAEEVPGWKVGDRIIITATRFFRSDERHVYRNGIGCASEKIVKALDGTRLTLDAPLEEDRQHGGEFQAEVANLSRSVVVESADPEGERGHTMYHRYSAGSIGYAEFRHLGKPGILGRYSLHYHLCGDTMRGSSVIGASVWDSGNRWLTIHGTNYLVVRDCVGYLSKGHGYYLEDGTEVYNVLDRNLAVHALITKPLPKQALPFDHNEAAGFWWANCLNTFTRNCSCGNERYGYVFEAIPSKTFSLTLPVLQPDGSRRPVDIRTLPFVRFEGNETHTEGTYGIFLGKGEGVERGQAEQAVGPDSRHPFVVRDTKIWAQGYAFRPQVQCLLVENMRLHSAAYGVYHPNYDRHVYRNLHISNMGGESFNRGHDDYSTQYGALTVDGLTFDNCGRSRDGTGMPMIQISDDNATGKAVSHFRNVKVINYGGGNHRVLVNRGGGNRPVPKTDKGVPVYVHDYYGPGKHAKVLSTAAKDFSTDGNKYREDFPLTGDESRVAEVADVQFPQLLDPIDDLPPTTVITHVRRLEDGKVLLRGTTADNGTVKRVLVNGQAAKALSPNYSEWEVTLPSPADGIWRFQAHAEDAAGNVEQRPHIVVIDQQR